MQTRTKLAVLELIGGLFGWTWILASVVAVYFLVAVFAFDGHWSSFFWALGSSVIAKWLARGFNDSKDRVAYEAEMVARGLSKEEAGKSWLQAYSGKGSQHVAADPLEAAQMLVNEILSNVVDGQRRPHCRPRPANWCSSEI